MMQYILICYIIMLQVIVCFFNNLETYQSYEDYSLKVMFNKTGMCKPQMVWRTLTLL